MRGSLFNRDVNGLSETAFSGDDITILEQDDVACGGVSGLDLFSAVRGGLWEP